MPWWFFRRKRAATAAPAPAADSPASARPRAWAGEVVLPQPSDDRPYLENQPYFLPRDLREVNRLDFQHYVLRALLRGNYLAPIRNPRQILDVGCGTGQWGYEMAREFPRAQVVGLDLEQAKNPTSPPPNYRFVAGDVLKGLPFADNTFDFVHQRLLFLALPVTAWPGVMQELVRVTAPGGWIELLELGPDVAPIGPATQRVISLTSQLASLRGLDGEGTVTRALDRYLLEAGLIHVERRFIDAPAGDWAGRVGSLLALDFREGWVAVSGPIARRFNLTQEEVNALTEGMVREWNELKTVYRFVAAYGQKP
jgi:ubiquinone/menaquinone biosynthesis C-methylase UbiE